MITCYFESGSKAQLRHVVSGAIIVKNDKILLVKRSTFIDREPGKWTVPGGYLDQGETIKQGILREIKEETGFKAKIISLFRINDNPKRDRANVDFIFLVKAIKKVGHHDKEISEVKWFALDRLPPRAQIAFDHWENIQLYLQWRKEKFPLPIFGGIKNAAGTTQLFKITLF